MATALSKIFGDTGPETDLVPCVDPADIRNMWKVGNELQALYPDEQIMVGIELYTEVCGPGANVRAVFERTSNIGLLQIAEILKSDEVIEDVVFDALATIPMQRMRVGIKYDGFPFDIEDFLTRISQGRRNLLFSSL